ncbi:hypothetical protein [Streptomyces sp. KR80]|uniref:hypothetical protein n=1 Tax=Streptomyces sp. KR80 TaxID=3457426 RepID=UPI003FCF5CC1
MVAQLAMLAHRGGRGVRTPFTQSWGLIVVDEAHRTSGYLGKPWAVVHDNPRMSAARRLYSGAMH